MTTSRTIRISVGERRDGDVIWRLQSVYENGGAADTSVRSLEEVWHHAAEQGIERNDVVFKGKAFEQLQASGLSEFRNVQPCPACAQGSVIFDPLSVRRSDDDRVWFTIEAFDHSSSSCAAAEWSWDRVKDVIRVSASRGT